MKVMKPCVGSIIQFTTKRGFAYGQVSHEHEEFANLVRVFDGFFESPPATFTSIILLPVRFSAFTHLKSAVRQGLVSIVDIQPVPERLMPFPLFRSGSYDSKTQTCGAWWLWDGKSEWKVGTLTAEEWKYPNLGVWNIALIVERLESGWIQEGSLW